MDENGQNLRIATTSKYYGRFSNNIFVLDYYLKPYGSLSGIACGD